MWQNPVQSRHEIWSLRHPLRRVARGKILRIILAAEATIVWSMDGWAHTNKSEPTHESGLDLWFADFPTQRLACRFGVYVYLLLEARSALAGPQLASDRFMKSRKSRI